MLVSSCNKWYSGAVVLFFLLLSLSSCQGRREGDPTPETKRGQVGFLMFLYDGEGYTQVTDLKSVMATSFGRVSGVGSYQINDRVVVTAEVISDEYLLHSLYEKDDKEGFTRVAGLVNETSNVGAYNKVKDTSCTITFYIKTDMVFVAVFTKKGVDNPDLPPLPPIEGSVTIGVVSVAPSEVVGDTIRINANEYN